MSSMANENSNNLLSWIKIAADSENLKSYKVTFHDSSEDNAGLLSTMVYATVSGIAKNGKNKTLEVVIKSSKTGHFLRRLPAIQRIFEREIYIYDKVVPAFKALQCEKTDENLLKFLPKAHVLVMTNDSEVVILENLLHQGYSQKDRQQYLSLDYIKLILETYGKLHGFSFALRQEKPHVFQGLTESMSNCFGNAVDQTKVIDYVEHLFDTSRKNCIDPEEMELSNIMSSLSGNIRKIIFELYDDCNDKVILHGDGWTNNYMFKSQDDMRIFDFQFSGFSSPVIDLSYFIYGCCQTDKYPNVKKFLEIYYMSLRKTVKKLGHDVDKIFPFDTLLHHWKKYSCFGVTWACLLVRFFLYDKDELPDFEKTLGAGKEFAASFPVKMKRENEYNRRIRNNFLHYVKNLNVE